MTDFLTLQNDALSVQISPFGAALARVFARGHDTSLVLGLANAQAYQHAPDYIGVVVGPIAGRLANARLPLKGETLQLTPNEGAHLLHSGPDGLSNQLWEVQDHSADSLTLAYTLPDGAVGLPGNRHVTARYSLNGPDLILDIEAQSDQDTVFSAVPHPYWCLDDSGALDDHHIHIFGDAQIELADDLTPTGQLIALPADGLRRPVRAEPELDDCFSTPQSGLAARVTSAKSGITLEVLSNQPGLVVYSGQFLNAAKSPPDTPKIAPFSGLALEPGGWPDAPNRPNFPQILLPRGEIRRQQTVYRVKIA